MVGTSCLLELIFHQPIWKICNPQGSGVKIKNVCNQRLVLGKLWETNGTNYREDFLEGGKLQLVLFWSYFLQKDPPRCFFMKFRKSRQELVNKKKKSLSYHHPLTIPQGSMYGIFAYIYHQLPFLNQPTVGKKYRKNNPLKFFQFHQLKSPNKSPKICRLFTIKKTL